MRDCYILFFIVGSYGDEIKHALKVFTDKELAEQSCATLNQLATVDGVHCDIINTIRVDKYDLCDQLAEQYPDRYPIPSLYLTSDGIKYFLIKVPLMD